MSQQTKGFFEQEAFDEDQEPNDPAETAEDEQDEQGEDAQDDGAQKQEDEDINFYSLPGPTQSVTLAYPELALPSGEPMDSLTAAFAREVQLAAGATEEDRLAFEKLQGWSKLSRRVVSEFSVSIGQDDKPVSRETNAMHFMSFEFKNRFSIERDGFMVQGPPQSKQHAPGQYQKPAIMKSFPREDVIVGSMSQLANIDGRGARNKEKTWPLQQQAQVRGAVSRIGGRVLVGSGVLLGTYTVVAFPGVCTSDAAFLSVAQLDLTPAPFTDVKAAKNAAVLYTESLVSDYVHFKQQAYKIDRYAMDGYVPDKKDEFADKEQADEPPPRSLVPRFALVHRVVGKVSEVIALLARERGLLEEQKTASDTPNQFQEAIDGADERIAELECYEETTEVDFYAYQVLDEKQAIATYTEKLSTYNKPECPATQLHNCVKTIIERQNTITYTIDWTYRSFSEPEAHLAFAKIALPIVPHAVYAQLEIDYVPEGSTPKKGAKRNGAGVPISATLTENHVLALPPPELPTPLPTRTVRFVESKTAPDLDPLPTRTLPSSKPLTPAPPTKTAAPTTGSATSASALLRKATTSTTPATSARKADVPKTMPPKAPPTKVDVDEDVKSPVDAPPSAKKPRTQQPPAKAEPSTPGLALMPRHTPEQQGFKNRLRELLPKMLSRPQGESFGVWGDLITADATQDSDYAHPDPPTSMRDAMTDFATALVYGGMAEAMLHLLNQEAAATRAPPSASRRPEY